MSVDILETIISSLFGNFPMWGGPLKAFQWILLKKCHIIQFIFSLVSLTRKLGLVIDPLSLVGGTSGCNVHWCWALFFFCCLFFRADSEKETEKKQFVLQRHKYKSLKHGLWGNISFSTFLSLGLLSEKRQWRLCSENSRARGVFAFFPITLDNKHANDYVFITL